MQSSEWKAIICKTGKLDTDSEEELAQVAAKLHRQNTERRAEELRKRDEYFNNGNANPNAFQGNGRHMTMPHAYTHQYGKHATVIF